MLSYKVEFDPGSEVLAMPWFKRSQLYDEQNLCGLRLVLRRRWYLYGESVRAVVSHYLSRCSPGRDLAWQAIEALPQSERALVSLKAMEELIYWNDENRRPYGVEWLLSPKQRELIGNLEEDDKSKGDLGLILSQAAGCPVYDLLPPSNDPDFQLACAWAYYDRKCAPNPLRLRNVRLEGSQPWLRYRYVQANLVNYCGTSLLDQSFPYIWGEAAAVLCRGLEGHLPAGQAMAYPRDCSIVLEGLYARKLELIPEDKLPVVAEMFWGSHRTLSEPLAGALAEYVEDWDTLSRMGTVSGSNKSWIFDAMPASHALRTEAPFLENGHRPAGRLFWDRFAELARRDFPQAQAVLGKRIRPGRAHFSTVLRYLRSCGEQAKEDLAEWAAHSSVTLDNQSNPRELGELLRYLASWGVPAGQLLQYVPNELAASGYPLSAEEAGALVKLLSGSKAYQLWGNRQWARTLLCLEGEDQRIIASSMEYWLEAKEKAGADASAWLDDLLSEWAQEEPEEAAAVMERLWQLAWQVEFGNNYQVLRRYFTKKKRYLRFPEYRSDIAAYLTGVTGRVQAEPQVAELVWSPEEWRNQVLREATYYVTHPNTLKPMSACCLVGVPKLFQDEAGRASLNGWVVRHIGQLSDHEVFDLVETFPHLSRVRTVRNRLRFLSCCAEPFYSKKAVRLMAWDA